MIIDDKPTHKLFSTLYFTGRIFSLNFTVVKTYKLLSIQYFNSKIFPLYSGVIKIHTLFSSQYFTGQIFFLYSTVVKTHKLLRSYEGLKFPIYLLYYLRKTIRLKHLTVKNQRK